MRASLHYLLQQRVYLLAFFSVVYVVYLAWIFGAVQLEGFVARVLAVLTPLAILELILRLLLRVTYGKEYRYSLYNYFLIDDPIYGNHFRPAISTRTIDFLICDKYVFGTAKVNPTDLAVNKSQRVHFSINSRNFRGPEFSPKKTPGGIRIFCTGGSAVAGNSVDDDQTWPALLEHFLRTKGYRVEVINAGVQGWYSYQELLRFKKEILTYEPDIVLIQQGWNEEFIYSSQNLGRWWQPRVVRNFIEEKYLFSFPNQIISNTSSLLFFFLMRLYFKDLVFDRQMSFANPNRWRCLKHPEYLAAWFDNLVEFAREAIPRRILLRTINSPALVDIKDVIEKTTSTALSDLAFLKTNYLAASQKRIEKTLGAASSFIPVIDVAAAFQSSVSVDRRSLFHDNFHTNAAGNNLFAETVGKKLIAEGIFTGPDKLKGEVVTLPPASELERLRRETSVNYDFLEDFVDRQIAATLTARQ